MRTSSYGKGPKGKATRLHSLVVRTRGRCERCDQTDYSKLQCAHIIPRRYAATRTDEQAAWCLCAACHMRLTENPDEHMALVAETIGMERFYELKARAERGVKTSAAFWQAEIERLSRLLGEEAA